MLSADYGTRPFGGIGVHVNGLTTALRSTGHHVDVIAPMAEGLPPFPGQGIDYLCKSIGPEGMVSNPELYSLGSPTLTILQDSIGIAAASPDNTKTGYDIIHAHDFRVLNAGVALSEKYRCPLVATKHTFPARHWPELSVAYARLVESWGYPQCKRIIAVSKAGLEDLRQHAKVSSSRCAIIPNGSDFTLEDDNLPPLPTMKKMLFVGRLQDTKGPDIAIKILTHLPESFQLIIAGGGPLRKALERLVCSLELENRVTLVGKVPRDKMRAMYLTAGLLLAPSRTEMGSVAIREAQALGVPVAATAVGGNPELLAYGAAGLLLPVDDEEKAAKLISGWAEKSNASEVIEARRRAFERSRKLTWTAVAEQTVNEYLAALNSSGN